MASSQKDSKRRSRTRRAGAAALATAGCVAAAAAVAVATVPSSVTAQLAQYSAKPTSIGTGWVALKTKPPKRTVVYLGTSEVSNVQVANAVQQAAGLAHWTFAKASYDPANPATFTAAFNVAIAKHANYVVEAGTPLPPSVISAAAAHKIKIATVAVAPITVTGPVIDSSDGYSQDYLMGKLVADEFIANSNGAGKAILEAVPAYPILTTFKEGFMARVKADCPNCKVSEVDVSIPDLAAGKLAADVVAAVKSNPGYNYLVTDDGPFFDGIVPALSAQGITGEKVLGEAGDQTGFTDLKNGTNLMWTGYSVPFPAYEAMDAAFRNSEGMKVPAADATQPTQVATHTNANGIVLYPNLGGWAYPLNELSQLKKLWHLG